MPGTIGVKRMDDDNLVRLLSYREQMEAIEEHLAWIEQEKGMLLRVYNGHVARLEQQKLQALAAKQRLVMEHKGGSAT